MSILPKFTIFTSIPVSDHESMIAQAFDKNGLIPQVDAVHHNSYTWFRQNFSKVPHCFYHIDDDQVIPFNFDELSEDMVLTPDLAIYFNEDTQDINWGVIEAWLCYHITPNGHEKFTDLSQVQKFREIYSFPEPQKQLATQTPPPPQQSSSEYHFRLCVIPEQDICLYEVMKPHTDLPYTSVTKNFSQIGHIQFFGDLFICESWGVTPLDIQFLQKVWTHLQMVGDYDPEKVYRDRVEACFPTPTTMPTSEPQVYRRTLEEVHQRVMDHNDGMECVHIGKRSRGKVPQK